MCGKCWGMVGKSVVDVAKIVRKSAGYIERMVGKNVGIQVKMVRKSVDKSRETSYNKRKKVYKHRGFQNVLVFSLTVKGKFSVFMCVLPFNKRLIPMKSSRFACLGKWNVI